ncbi:tyrosine-type recombinase/integrase [Spirosoma migulaei]
MSRLTYHIELSPKPDKTGRSTVSIRLHMKGQKPGRVLTQVKIDTPATCWNPKKTWGQWVIKHPDKDRLNTRIKNEHNRVEDQVEKWQAAEPTAIFSPLLLAERFRAGIPELYFEWIDKVLVDAQDQAYSTYVNKRSAANIFRTWAVADLLLASVTPVLVRQYQDYLVKSEKEYGGRRVGLTINTMLDRMHVLHQAILIKTGISPKQAFLLSPWTDVIRLKEVKTQRAKLHETTIEQVADLRVTSRRWRITPTEAFQIWMLAHLFAGMRFSDVIQLRYAHFTLDAEGNPTQLRYRMLKTGHLVHMPIFEEARQLLQLWWKADAGSTDYLLPYMDNQGVYAKLLTYDDYKAASFAIKRKLYNTIVHWNRKVNLSLRPLKQAAGLADKLTMHNARHSFADRARRMMQQGGKLTMYDIQMMLGHSRFKTTEIYTKDLQEPDLINPMQAIFGRSQD